MLEIPVCRNSEYTTKNLGGIKNFKLSTKNFVRKYVSKFWQGQLWNYEIMGCQVQA